MSGFRSREDRVITAVAHIVMIILSVLAIAPFLLLVSGSFTENNTAIRYGYQFWPRVFSLDAYEYIVVQWQQIGTAYLMTIVVTVAGTALSLLVMSLLAYGLSKRDIPGMRLLSLLIVFTMLFNGGVVATYMIYTNIFHIKDTVWALIFPNLFMNAFSVILVKNYMQNSIPGELMEAAEIDGAGQFQVLFKIVMPLSKPILATVGLLGAVAYWNDWTNGLYYITDSKLYTIQLLLNEMNNNIQFLTSNAASLASGLSTSNIPSASIRMAIAVVAILPIIVAYPFFQKYFAKGITMGAVKG